MHIKENLVYEKHSGSLIGFVDLGDINNHLISSERAVDHASLDDLPLAKLMMTFMVRGLFITLQFPYAQFPCANVSGELLFDPFWEAVYYIERCGFKVHVCVHCTCMLIMFTHTCSCTCICTCATCISKVIAISYSYYLYIVGLGDNL